MGDLIQDESLPLSTAAEASACSSFAPDVANAIVLPQASATQMDCSLKDCTVSCYGRLQEGCSLSTDTLHAKTVTPERLDAPGHKSIQPCRLNVKESALPAQCSSLVYCSGGLSDGSFNLEGHECQTQALPRSNCSFQELPSQAVEVEHPQGLERLYSGCHETILHKEVKSPFFHLRASSEPPGPSLPSKTKLLAPQPQPSLNVIQQAAASKPPASSYISSHCLSSAACSSCIHSSRSVVEAGMEGQDGSYVGDGTAVLQLMELPGAGHAVTRHIPQLPDLDLPVLKPLGQGPEERMVVKNPSLLTCTTFPTRMDQPSIAIWTEPEELQMKPSPRSSAAKVIRQHMSATDALQEAVPMNCSARGVEDCASSTMASGDAPCVISVESKADSRSDHTVSAPSSFPRPLSEGCDAWGANSTEESLLCSGGVPAATSSHGSALDDTDICADETQGGCSVVADLVLYLPKAAEMVELAQVQIQQANN
jgi:hypothetical protein